jgi:hypothetical protein
VFFSKTKITLYDEKKTKDIFIYNMLGGRQKFRLTPQKNLRALQASIAQTKMVVGVVIFMGMTSPTTYSMPLPQEAPALNRVFPMS